MLTEPDMRNALSIVLWELIKLLSGFIRGDRKKVTGGIIRKKDRSLILQASSEIEVSRNISGDFLSLHR